MSQMEELEREDGDPNVTIEDIQGASAILYVAGAETASHTRDGRWLPCVDHYSISADLKHFADLLSCPLAVP